MGKMNKKGEFMTREKPVIEFISNSITNRKSLNIFLSQEGVVNDTTYILRPKENTIS